MDDRGCERELTDKRDLANNSSCSQYLIMYIQNNKQSQHISSLSEHCDTIGAQVYTDYQTHAGSSGQLNYIHEGILEFRHVEAQSKIAPP